MSGMLSIEYFPSDDSDHGVNDFPRSPVRSDGDGGLSDIEPPTFVIRPAVPVSTEKAKENMSRRKKKKPTRRDTSSKPLYEFRKRSNRPGLEGLATRFVKDKRLNSVQLCIPRAPFQRMVRSVANEIVEDVKFHKDAIEALRESSETFLVNLFEDSNLCTLHANRVTLQVSDMKLAIRLANPCVLYDQNSGKQA